MPDSVNVGSGVVVSVEWPVHSDFPWLAVRIDAVAIDFTYIYKHVLDTEIVKISGYDIATVALCNGIEIKFCRYGFRFSGFYTVIENGSG